MWYDKMVIRLLLAVAKIMARYGKSTYAHEIEEFERDICKEGEMEND